ncbi:MAG TPA: argininosuccinate lyase [Planctomycetota bacterium]|nr:argininosuccinate lyase [Planctomycetota bacterium]
MTDPTHHAPIWDRGEPVDAEMLRFTIGDDWVHDRRLVEHDIRGSLAHAAGLMRAKLVEARDYEVIRRGLEELLAEFRRGEWTVEASDEDVHSAVERRLIERVGDAGKRLHTGRSRNEQVAVDVRLWLRDAIAAQRKSLQALAQSCGRLAERNGALPMPGYTHLRRAMPSTVAEWIGAHGRAFEEDEADLVHAARRTRESPLGTGAGYGVPLELDRAFVAQSLGFERPQMPVTAAQHSRGRAELAYATALEAVALDLGKLAFDLWLFSTSEFGFVRIPTAFTTGSSLMPQKRNPDVVELVRAHARQVVTDRAALLDVLRDLPSGYHRDFQLLKPPLFRAHDRVAAMLPLAARLLDALELDEAKLKEACADPALQATARALEKARKGMPFRDAYREESQRP